MATKKKSKKKASKKTTEKVELDVEPKEARQREGIAPYAARRPSPSEVRRRKRQTGA